MNDGEVRAGARRGSFLFTHFGLSGTVALDVSRAITAPRAANFDLVCDFSPALPTRRSTRMQDDARGRHPISIVLLPDGSPRRRSEALEVEALPEDLRCASGQNKTGGRGSSHGSRTVGRRIGKNLGFKRQR